MTSFISCYGVRVAKAWIFLINFAFQIMKLVVTMRVVGLELGFLVIKEFFVCPHLQVLVILFDNLFDILWMFKTYGFQIT